ncbi:class I SAM-dependent methyltransferase [Candidatus Bathyarchaeota archaeon]|nr:class I SAM-dependent methyltransferase [Candidatus Bathyarchaeota archaeon]MBT7912445.1 class I SAM-dependent methyltransferase [Candidatus Bathyarchaeota archaeon]
MSRDYSRKSGKEFSRIASEYDKGRRGEDLELWGNETKRLASLEEEDVVLDLGCGTGLYTVGIGRASDALMLGMDPAVGMLGQAREKSRDVHWFNGIGEWLPVRDGILDCIFSSQVWHHIQDRQGTADECGRALKDYGTVVIRTIGHRQLHQKVVFKYFPEIKQNQLDVYPSDEEFKEYFDKADFRDVEFHEYSEERYQTVEGFIEIATKKLWSMFRPITEEGLSKGIAELRQYYEDTGGSSVRNDEMITLVVPRK